jgi:hypothetical protein
VRRGLVVGGMVGRVRGSGRTQRVAAGGWPQGNADDVEGLTW